VSVQVSPEDQVRARKHLGYLNVTSAMTFNGGIPAATQTQFMIEGAFPKILPEALTLFRDYLCKLDQIEETLAESMPDLEAKKVGSIELRDDHFEKLVQRYKYWRSSLGNLLGVMPNPFDFRFGGSMAGDGPSGVGGGINVSVAH